MASRPPALITSVTMSASQGTSPPGLATTIITQFRHLCRFIVIQSLRAQNIEISRVSAPKQTGSTQRWKLTLRLTDAFAGQVLAYLEPEYQEHYRSRQVWEDLQQQVVDALHALRP